MRPPTSLAGRRPAGTKAEETQEGRASPGPYKGERRGRYEFYLGEKISELAGLEAEVEATTLRVASISLVTGGRQISVLQAWYRNFMGTCWGPSGAVRRTVSGRRMVTLPE